MQSSFRLSAVALCLEVRLKAVQSRNHVWRALLARCSVAGIPFTTSHAPQEKGVRIWHASTCPSNSEWQWPAGLWIRRNTIGCCSFLRVMRTFVSFQILPHTTRQLTTARLKASFHQSWRGCPPGETPAYPLLPGKCYRSYPYFWLRNRNSMLLEAGIPLGRTLFWPQSMWRKHSAESSHRSR
jgi:hypothetical protein